MGDLRGPKRTTAKFRAMLAAYAGDAKFNLTEAARMAGYGEPSRAGWKLKQRFPELFEEAEAAFREGLRVKREEVETRIAALVRNPQHRDHYKALELSAKMHGLLSERLSITLERKTLDSQLDELIQAMMASRAVAKGISIEIEPAEVPLIPERIEPKEPVK